MPNDALRRVMAEARLTERDLAERVGTDPRTVQRWIADPSRVPQPRLRWAVCDVLGTDEAMLWPSVKAAIKTGPDREIVEVFPTHSAVPASIWQRLIADASREIVFAGALYDWLWYEIPDLSAVLRGKAEAGARVRFIVSDPASPIVQADEQATGAPVTFSARIAQTLHRLEPLRDVVAVRQSPMGYGRGVARGDDVATLHVWVHGAPGTDLPVLHLRRRQLGGIFDQMAVRHVDALWEAAVPVWP